MAFIDFIAKNWDSIVLVLIVLVCVLYLLFKGKKDIIFKMIKSLVTEAEKTFGNGTGAFKLAWVVEKLYPKIPSVVKPFVTEQMLTNWIEDVLTITKEEWEKNNNIQNYLK